MTNKLPQKHPYQKRVISVFPPKGGKGNSLIPYSPTLRSPCGRYAWGEFVRSFTEIIQPHGK